MSESLSRKSDKVLILMRGLPSSGKSYRALELAGGNDAIVFSADKFWGKSREEYLANWCRDRLHLAHAWCQRLVKEAMERAEPLVVVDNTHTKMSEMSVYYKMAVEHGYTIRIEEPTSPWWLNDIAPYLADKVTHRVKLREAVLFLHEKNKETHGVPLDTMQAMMDRYQPNVTVESLAINHANSATPFPADPLITPQQV